MLILVFYYHAIQNRKQAIGKKGHSAAHIY